MKTRLFNAILLAALLVCGCTTTRTRIYNSIEINYDPVGQTFTIKNSPHPPFAPRDIATVLKKAGLKPDAEIHIVGKFDNPKLIADVATRLENAGYHTYFFSTAHTAESYAGKMHDDLLPLPNNAPPRVIVNPPPPRSVPQKK